MNGRRGKEDRTMKEAGRQIQVNGRDCSLTRTEYELFQRAMQHIDEISRKM